MLVKILNKYQIDNLSQEQIKQVEYLLSSIGFYGTLNEYIKDIFGEHEVIFAIGCINTNLLNENKNETQKKEKIIGMLNVFKLSDNSKVNARVNNKLLNTELYNKFNNTLYISSVVIHIKFRGEGYGKKMLIELIKQLKQDLILEVVKTNEIAINLYKKLKFKLIAENLTESLMHFNFS